VRSVGFDLSLLLSLSVRGDWRLEDRAELREHSRYRVRWLRTVKTWVAIRYSYLCAGERSTHHWLST